MHDHREPVRAGAASGVLFVVLFVGGVIPLGDLLGSFGDPDATFDTYFASGGNRAANIVGGALLGASAFVFLWFLHHLRQWLQPDETRAATAANIMFSAGLVFVVLLLVGIAALVAVPITLAFGDLYDTDDVLKVGQAVLPQTGLCRARDLRHVGRSGDGRRRYRLSSAIRVLPAMALSTRFHCHRLPCTSGHDRRHGLLRSACMGAGRQRKLVAGSESELRRHLSRSRLGEGVVTLSA